jgi:hypothetical protein
MIDIVSALLPPVLVGGAFIAGIVWLVRGDARAKEAERARRAAGLEPE